MIAKSFDPATAREMVGDERARTIENKARSDADSNIYDPPQSESVSYWGQCQEDFATQVYAAQYRKRMARIERKQVAP